MTEMETQWLCQGMKVNVYNRTMSGKLIFEGEATVLTVIGCDENECIVRFDDDPPDAEYRRYIDPQGQNRKDPKAWVDSINQMEAERKSD